MNFFLNFFNFFFFVFLVIVLQKLFSKLPILPWLSNMPTGRNWLWSEHSVLLAQLPAILVLSMKLLDKFNVSTWSDERGPVHSFLFFFGPLNCCQTKFRLFLHARLWFPSVADPETGLVCSRNALDRTNFTSAWEQKYGYIFSIGFLHFIHEMRKDMQPVFASHVLLPLSFLLGKDAEVHLKWGRWTAALIRMLIWHFLSWLFLSTCCNDDMISLEIDISVAMLPSYHKLLYKIATA